jgi:hypothetical protein
VNEHACACGYQATSAEDLRDHFAEMFTPDDDTAPDGQVHAEAANGAASARTGLACLCGFTADGIADLDAHLARAFTPADRIGRDGDRHDRASTDRACEMPGMPCHRDPPSRAVTSDSPPPATP